MFSGQSAEYQICLPSRHISSLPADPHRHRFLVGTCFIPGRIENNPNSVITGNNDGNNELHLLRFHEDMNEIIVDMILDHPTGEVWQLKPSHVDANVVLTCGGRGETVLWRIPGLLPEGEEYHEEDIQSVLESPRTVMEEMTRLPLDTRLDTAIWNPDAGSSWDLVTINRNKGGDEPVLSQWDLSSDAVSIQTTPLSGPSSSSSLTPIAAAWDPHSPSMIGHSHGRHVSLHDLRSPSAAVSLPFLHRYDVTSLDYNPNRPGIIVTGGDDALIKFWDVRMTSSSSSSPSSGRRRLSPLKICRGGHSHSVTAALYNPFHDQLVLSGGSDERVNLWRVSSISSAPLLELSEEEEGGEGADVRVETSDHQESVYGVSWSACDAWCYGLVSFDGQVVVNQVPSKEKYKILL